MTSALTIISVSNPGSYGSKETSTTTETATHQHTYDWSSHPEVQQVPVSLPALPTDLNTGNGALALLLNTVEDATLPATGTMPQSSSNKKRKRPTTEVRSEPGGTAQYAYDWSSQNEIPPDLPVSKLASYMNFETEHGFVMKLKANLLSEDATRAELETHAPFARTSSCNLDHIVDSNARTEAMLANYGTIFSNFETHDSDHTLSQDINPIDLNQLFTAPTTNPIDLNQLFPVPTTNDVDLNQLFPAPTTNPVDLNQFITTTGDTFDERILANSDGRAFEQGAINTSTNSSSGLSMFNIPTTDILDLNTSDMPTNGIFIQRLPDHHSDQISPIGISYA
ncbi:hypothetical protein AYL99_12031 [Fonsecaea erecta]|uniref:Uncharacterized protein n=1 Tax=Fonsecaea erecta TaxID=1367422 RepID=A0A178Z3U5_9EURO|nr:hypothetical protein AYL99_12031 [Fonsecaea erecta]OAP53765.1 hypothetical protein AYL99_12031 [Fonsecaea erecta]